MGIESYSTTAANNNSASPNGFPEGMAPSGVNDSARQVMADIRTWYETAEWVDYGDTTVYSSGTVFTEGGGVDLTTSRYSVGRRVRAVGSTTGTIYGTISTATYSNPTNTITVVWDSGSLQSETLTISVGIVNPTNSSFHVDSLVGARFGEYLGKVTGGGATYDFEDMETGYSYFFRFVRVVPATDGVSLEYLVRTDGGSYETTGYNNVLYTIEATGTGTVSSSETGGSGGTSGAISTGVSNVSGDSGLSGVMQVYNAMVAATIVSARHDVVVVNGGTFVANSRGSSYRSAGAYDAVRFRFASGNIASGTIERWRVAEQ